MSGSPLVKLDRVSRSYAMGDITVTALHPTTLEIDAGHFVAIAGPSGSGKSTLLNLIAGIDKPTTGSVVVGGAAVSELDEDSLARWRGKQVGLIFQFFQLLPTLSALENVLLPMQFVAADRMRRAAKDRREQALTLLERVGMRSRSSHLPSELSGGEQQRVAIARALANDPPLLIADEPTGNLDSSTSDQIIELLLDIHRQGRTIILVTHQPELAGVANRVIRLQDGRVVP